MSKESLMYLISQKMWKYLELVLTTELISDFRCLSKNLTDFRQWNRKWNKNVNSFLEQSVGNDAKWVKFFHRSDWPTSTSQCISVSFDDNAKTVLSVSSLLNYYYFFLRFKGFSAKQRFQTLHLPLLGHWARSQTINPQSLIRVLRLPRLLFSERFRTLWPALV